MDRRATPREAGNRNQNQFLSVGRKEVTTAFMPICLCCDGVTAAGRRNPRPAEARRATTNAATRITTSALWRARATQHGRVCATALPLTTDTQHPPDDPASRRCVSTPTVGVVPARLDVSLKLPDCAGESHSSPAHKMTSWRFEAFRVHQLYQWLLVFRELAAFRRRTGRGAWI